MSVLANKKTPTRPAFLEALEGCYIQVGHTTIRVILEGGKYKWGSRDIYEYGTFTATQPDDYSCVVEFYSELVKTAPRRRYRFTRRGKTYTVKELPEGAVYKFKREDEAVFLAESLPGVQQGQSALKPTGRKKTWRHITSSNATVSFYLTGESIVRAVTIPAPPSSKTPTVVRVTHSNAHGWVDSDVYVRLGNTKKPLGVKDFDTVSDWQGAPLVEDLGWNGKEWMLRAKAKGDTSDWSGTYEIEIQFQKGHHQIELKVVSRVPEVCSIVLSNWKVYVR